MYLPIRRAIVHYHWEDSMHVLDSVDFNFDPAEVFEGEKVLIVDNSIESGATLEETKSEVEKHTDHVKTLVVYDKECDRGTKVEPDIVLFESVKEKQFLK